MVTETTHIHKWKYTRPVPGQMGVTVCSICDEPKDHACETIPGPQAGQMVCKHQSCPVESFTVMVDLDPMTGVAYSIPLEVC